MTTEPAKSAPCLRAPLAGVSALLMVSLVLGATLSAAKPAVRDSGRDNATERIAVRELTASLARAVRKLTGSEHHKPCLHLPVRLAGAPGRAVEVRASSAADSGPQVSLLRDALLDMPPPYRV